MNKQWFKDVVVYQVYPMSFQDSNNDGIGDLNGIKERLPYLQKLGVDVIWLNPIYESPNQDNGYDISNYEKIQPVFGTMDDFNDLLDAIHKHGMKLLMDLVVNHTSDQHRWFKESKKSRHNKYADFYIWRDPVDGHEPNNWGSNFSGSAWTYVPERKQYYLHSFASGQPDLNWDNPEVRKNVYQMMRFWLDKGVDGFRMDVINYISKPKDLSSAPAPNGSKYAPIEPIVTNGPHLNDYIHEMNREVLSKYNVMTVGEMPNTKPEDAVKYANLDGKGLNMIFQFEHVKLSANSNKRLGKWSDKKIRLTELKKALSRWQNGLDGRSWNSLYWNNHDQPRAVSRFATDDPKYRILAAKMLGTTLHMMQGTPYVYEGEELGMTNNHYHDIHQYEDVESINAYHQFSDKEKIVKPNTMLNYLADRSRDNSRTPMQWNNDQNAGFSKVKPWYPVNPNYKYINVDVEKANPYSILHYYQRLIRIRHHLDLIRYGNYEELDPDDDQAFSYKRHYGKQTLLVISNFTDKVIERDYKQDRANELLISNYPDDKGRTIRPYETKVYLFI
ncbi:glucohydrolase [Philodulcilactobacillus myokoensis]|uniref:Glucohydrolase n=1 Tax=Philodulcilactobacillus myokoensis TaxID=2929573 RepID=A0A9W6ESL3_9LACO|nr:alpha-glucosidase [Philodulcilactobacillus myokoensis]GLB46448.1 glucohydrolase [Philodulcilactobacillus myokoensis]